MTIDGIPETLPPIAGAAERSPSGAAEPRSAPLRRRAIPALNPNEDEELEDAAPESHVLDDLL